MKLSLLKFIACAIGLYETNPFEKQGPLAELIKRLLAKESGRNNRLFSGGKPEWDGVKLAKGKV